MNLFIISMVYLRNINVEADLSRKSKSDPNSEKFPMCVAALLVCCLTAPYMLCSTEKNEWILAQYFRQWVKKADVANCLATSQCHMGYSKFNLDLRDTLIYETHI